MAKGRRFQSHSGATSATDGSQQKTRLHTTIGLYVETTNLDTGADTLNITLKGSKDGTHWTTIDRGAPAVDDVYELTASDFEQSDADNSVHVAYIVANNIAIEHVKAEITSFSDNSGGDLSVDSYVYLGGWTGRGKSYNEREGTP